jgi:hypothetical protein
MCLREDGMKFLAVGFLAGYTLLGSQRSPTDEALEADWQTEQEVIETVEHVLALLGGLRFYALEQYFTEDANIIAVRKTKSQFVSRVVSARTWIQNLMEGPAPQPFEEVLSNIDVAIESGELASVRADFEIVRDGKVESRGHDMFTLVRQSGQWKICSIAYTSIPTFLEDAQ